jgi:hypothetical protein
LFRRVRFIYVESKKQQKILVGLHKATKNQKSRKQGLTWYAAALFSQKSICETQEQQQTASAYPFDLILYFIYFDVFDTTLNVNNTPE